jgi:hypothetical protein
MYATSRSFKVLSLVARKKNIYALPTFDWENVSVICELGVGSFGSIHFGKYAQANGDEDKTVVVKKLKGESAEAKHRFLKEAEMWNSCSWIQMRNQILCS